MTSTLDQLRALVRDNPTDWQARRILADALEDVGEVELANGARWQAREKKRPRWSLGTRTWDWWLGDEPVPDCEDNRIEVPCNLTADVFKALKGHACWRDSYKEYSSIPAAESALAVALWSLNIFVRGDET